MPPQATGPAASGGGHVAGGGLRYQLEREQALTGAESRPRPEARTSEGTGFAHGTVGEGTLEGLERIQGEGGREGLQTP